MIRHRRIIKAMRRHGRIIKATLRHRRTIQTTLRHGSALFAPLPVITLAVAMIQPPFRAALMTLIGPPPLLLPRPLAAGLAAIAMSTVTVRAQEESCHAFRAETGPLHQYRFMRRHACPQARRSEEH